MSKEATTLKDGSDHPTEVADDLFGPARARISERVTGFGGAHSGYVAATVLRGASLLVPGDRLAVDASPPR